MTALTKKGKRLIYNPGDPSASDPALREPSYTNGKSFSCNYRTMSRDELVNGGMVTDRKAMRVYYYSDRISFSRGDQVNINNRIYNISYIPDVAYRSKIEYIDIVSDE